MKAMIAAATLIVPVLAFANDDRMGAGSTKTMSMADRGQILGKIHQKAQMQIDLATLAASNAGSDKVRSFSKDILKEQQKLDRAVMDYAKDNKIALSTVFTDDTAAGGTGSDTDTGSSGMSGSTGMNNTGSTVNGTTGTGTGMTGSDTTRSGSTGMSDRTGSSIGNRMMGKAKERIDELRGLSGSQFDTQFLSTVRENSQHVISSLETAKANQTDKKLVRLIDRAIDTYRGLDKDAEKVQRNLTQG